MIQIITGSLILSLIHTAIPNHWLPLIAIGKTEKWTKKETWVATLITGFSHTLSTVMIGIIVGFAGVKLSAYYGIIAHYAAPIILITIGLVYVIIDRTGHPHHHHHDRENPEQFRKTKTSKGALLASLSLAMFLTPCIEIEAYYFQASLSGWPGIVAVSAVYVFTTVSLMLILVSLGMHGIRKIRSHLLEHHEKVVTGMVLIILGVLGLIFIL
jgi:nickel/cobalt transporter (NicO) family protein